MEKDFFSLFTPGQSAGLNSALLEAMLNSVPMGMQFLRVIRDNKNNITDFEHVMINNGGSNGVAERTFLNLYPGNKQLFEKLKELADNGAAFQTGYLSETGDRRASLNFIKFGDGILISRSDDHSQAPGNDGAKDKVGKHNNVDGQVVKKNRDVPAPLKASENHGELNNPLLEKNIELETFISELKTINSVASIEFKETTQRLYTNLEYIASNDARALSDTSKANIRRAQAAIQRMKLLSDDINSFLQLFDIGVNKSFINPNVILENVMTGIKGKLEQTNTQVESATLPDLFADPLLLSFLFTRILDNSIKFRKLIAPPLIRVRHSQADEMNAVSVAKKNTRYTIISISDNGIGLNDNEADKIFDLFFTIHDRSRYKGSGMGLAICKKIMTMHGGFITAEGSPAHGTTINCYFPSDR